MVNPRYTIAAQLREYDRLGQVWHPYLMTFHRPNYRSEVVNTDARGFRRSARGGQAFSNFELASDTPVCLVSGASVVFGFGASSDACTLPSQLNLDSECTWLNFGGKAFSSTQEFLLFLFHHPHFEDIRRVVFLSGIAELVMVLMGIRSPEVYGPFFNYESYDERMNSKRRSPLRKALDRVRRGGAKRGRAGSGQPGDPAQAVERYRHTLHNWRLLTSAMGVELAFVLQPMFNWMRKEPSAEERELFAALDGLASNTWNTIRDRFTMEQRRWYARELQGICADEGIPFHDGNEAFERADLDGEWLFVDRAHLTDAGNRVVADFFRDRGIQA